MTSQSWNWNSKDVEITAWASQFWIDRYKEADSLGMDIYDYMSKSSGGMLDGVLHKLKLHNEAHPLRCPPDCVFKTSLEKLKKKYRTEEE